MTSRRFDHIDAAEWAAWAVSAVVLFQYAIGIYRVVYFPL